MRCGKAPGGPAHPEFQVTDLIPGQDYKFRVAAVNDEGESEPLETEKAVKAKNPYGTSPGTLPRGSDVKAELDRWRHQTTA